MKRKHLFFYTLKYDTVTVKLMLHQLIRDADLMPMLLRFYREASALFSLKNY